MPRKKIQKTGRKSTISPSAGDSRKSLIAGVIILLGLALIFGIAAYKKYSKPSSTQPTPTQSPSTTSPTPAHTTITQPQISLIPSESTKSAETSKEEVVKKLPPTTKGKRMHTVSEGETLSEIGKRYCDDDRAYLTLIEKNNLVEPYTLHQGEMITIACPTH